MNNFLTRKAFTMIELVFVIVVLGILAATAIPRLAATRDDANIAKGRANILAIRSGIIGERQGRMFRGDSSWATTLDNAALNTEDVTLFNATNNNLPILQNGVQSRNADGRWMKTGNTQYTYSVFGAAVTFDYNTTNGVFDCAGAAGSSCALLTD
jgi:general secretion pathway protein G